MTYSTTSTPTSIAPVPGLLISVTDNFGYQLGFTYSTYNGQPLLATFTDPSGAVYKYAYSSGILSSVTYPDSTSRSYTYNENIQGSTNAPDALTGLFDESGTRYATFKWNSVLQVTSSVLAGNVNPTFIHPNVSMTTGSGSSTVIDAFGTSRTYSYNLVKGVVRFTGSSTLCLGCGDTPNTVGYDANGNVSQRVDFNGNTTTYVYDQARNVETSRVEASGTPHARTITTQWDTTWRQPAKVAQPLRITTYAYDGDSGVSCGGSNGSLCSKSVAATTDVNGSQGFGANLTGVSRTWTYTHDSTGRVLTAKGPRTDINSTTTYTYYSCATGYQCGQVQTVTDPVGNTTTYNTYNAYGQPLTFTDSNGTTTTLSYDARQRLTSRKMGSETTAFSYWPTGLLKQLTLPDGSYLLYTYDTAHRLTQINDELGNKVLYTLDARGNRTAENRYDPSGMLHYTHTSAFNTLNEFYQDINAANTTAVTTTFGYDNNGNQTSIAAPMSHNTAIAYDELNRVKQITDPGNGVTHLAYDEEDDMTSVIDPRNLTTSYTYTGFGDLKSVSSPDTGVTTNTYDYGGNLATSTDARGAITTYAYDALNRVKSASYKLGSSTDQVIAFSYDMGTNGKGHLTGASDANHAMSWTYDPQGRVVNKAQTIGSISKSVSYGYTNADLTSMTTPSGQTVTFGYNGNHQVTSLTLNGSTTLLNSVTYESLGPVNGWSWGNGTSTSRTYDTDQKSRVSAARAPRRLATTALSESAA